MPTPTINLGANLPNIFDWQPTNLFCNLFLHSRQPSQFSRPDLAGSIAVDADGNPVESFGLVVKAPLRVGDNGTYRLRYRSSTAEVAVYNWPPKPDHADPLPPPITLESMSRTGDVVTAILNIPDGALAGSQGEEPLLALQFSNLGGHAIQEMSLVKQELIRPDGSFPTFHPTWITHFSRFKVLRFMNWMSFWIPIPAMNWSDRPKTTRYTQAGMDSSHSSMIRGVAPEYIVELATALNCDIWINIPPRATDDYVSGLANFLKNNLPTSTKIYVEYGNEIWANDRYLPEVDRVPADATWQGYVNWDEAVAEVTRGESALGAGTDDKNVWAIRRYARRTKQIGDQFVSVFGASSRNNRIRPVYCYQSVDPAATLTPGLDFLLASDPVLSNAIWGIAPKTGLDETSMTGDVTADTFIAALNSALDNLIGGSTEHPVPIFEEVAATAAYYNVAFSGYEGGIGLVKNTRVTSEVAYEAMNRWDIHDLFSQYLQAWYSYGNDNLLCWFIAGASDWKGEVKSGQPDIHGLTWNISEQNTFPIQAIDQALNRTDGYPTLVGQSVPGRIDLRRHSGRTSLWENNFRSNWSAVDKYYLITAPLSRTYVFQLIAERDGGRDLEVEVMANNVRVAKLTIPMGNGTYTSVPFRVKLRKGLNAVKMNFGSIIPGNYFFNVR